MILLVLGASSSMAQKDCTLVLTGTITDEHGQTLPGATVVMVQNKSGKVSDANGSFQFEEVCPGSVSLEVKFLGYVTRQIKVDTKKAETLMIRLQQEEKMLSEIVVEGKAEQITATSNFGQLSGQALEETKGKSLGEALRSITGVSTIQSGPAIFKPVIHGVHSQRILILNNGIRQEGQQWGAEHAPEIDPFIASNIVVIKDAGAIKYGTDALGGVVIVNPAELPTTPGLGGQFNLIGNSNGWAGIASGMLEGGIKKHNGWGWRVQGTGKKSGDSHAANYILSNTGFTETNYSGSIGYHGEGKGVEAFYSHFNTTIGILRGSAVSSAEDLANALERDPPQYTEPFTYAIQQPRQEVSHDLLKLNGHIIKGVNRYNFQYGFQYNRREEFDVRKGALKEVPALGYKLFTHTLDAEWERTFGKNRVSCRGLNAMMQDNQKINGTQTIPFIPNFTNYSTGLFWIEKLSLAKWELEAGARYDFRFYKVVGFDFSNQIFRSQLDFHNISATVGSTYTISEKSTFTSTLGSAWRPPNVAELYSLGTHQSAAAIEFGLLLDETTNQVRDINTTNFRIEQALKWVNSYRFQTSRLSGEISGYVNYIFNYIYLKPRGVTQNLRGIFPYFRYTQTNASFLGADLSLSYQLNNHFKINSKVSLLRARDETQKDYLIFIPSNRYELALRYDHPVRNGWKNFFAEARVKYVAHQGRAPRVVTVREINDAKMQGVDLFATDNSNFDFAAAPQGYGLISLSAGISKPIKKSMLDVRISVDNLGNTTYREYTNRMRYYANDLGRNVSLALKYSF